MIDRAKTSDETRGPHIVSFRYVRRYEGWPEKASITSEKGHPLKFAGANFPTSERHTLLPQLLQATVSGQKGAKTPFRNQ